MNFSPYLKYKLLNSAFVGISVGSIFTIYAALDPELFHWGGIFLAVMTIVIARYYSIIMNKQWFWPINLLVEIVPTIMIAYFLLNSYSYTTAILIYCGYQVTFIFGAYLSRAETLIFSDKKELTSIDTYKQVGYIGGLGFAIGFYWLIEMLYGITDNNTQVYYMHYVLLLIQLINIYYFIRAKGDLK